jgi:peptide/nickel transport system substrate-binding protein
MTPKQGGTVLVHARTDPPSWRLVDNNYHPLTESRSMSFVSLFQRTNPASPQHCNDTQFYPRAVESWRMVDTTTAEFTLKKNMRFQNRPPVNGREVVAADLAASLNWYKANDKFTKPFTKTIESVEPVDQYTVRVHLAKPFLTMISEYFAGSSTDPMIIPEELLTGEETHGWQDPATSFVGSGPYIFQKWEPGVKFIFERNPDYFIEDRPYVDRVEYILTDDFATMESMFRSGKLDYISGAATEQTAKNLESVDGVQVFNCEGPEGINLGVVWMNNATPPFDNVLVRRAANMAVDRQGLIDAFFDGRGKPKGLFPPNEQYELPVAQMPSEAQEVLTYNQAKAKQLLAQAGYPDGFDTQIDAVNSYPYPSLLVYEAISQMLTEVGIRAKVNLMERARWLETVVSGKLPEGRMGITSAVFSGLESGAGLNGFHSTLGGRYNRSLVNDPEYDALYERFTVSIDDTEREKLAHQMQVLAVDRAYRIHLFTSVNTEIGQARLNMDYCCSQDWAIMMENMWLK